MVADAMIHPTAQTREVISFGPFSLVASERILTKDGAPIDLGARTFDTLIALASRPSEIVTKRDLLARVWPDVRVEEGSLRQQIGKLRKALGDRKGSAQYIATLAGRGYCFVAPIARASHSGDVDAAGTAGVPQTNLPSRLIRMVGRTDDV